MDRIRFSASVYLINFLLLLLLRSVPFRKQRERGYRTCPMAGWNENQFRKYNIKLEKIPVLQYDDPKVDFLLTNNVSNVKNARPFVRVTKFSVIEDNLGIAWSVNNSVPNRSISEPNSECSGSVRKIAQKIREKAYHEIGRKNDDVILVCVLQTNIIEVPFDLEKSGFITSLANRCTYQINDNNIPIRIRYL